jgi:hypothetical protein
MDLSKLIKATATLDLMDSFIVILTRLSANSLHSAGSSSFDELDWVREDLNGYNQPLGYV